MKSKGLLNFIWLPAIVLFWYGSAVGQDEPKDKSTLEKAKDATVQTTKKTVVVVKDALDKAEDKTADATKDTAKTVGTTTKSFGKNAVNVTENISGQAYEGGKWFMVTTWDGAKWVSKRTWFPDKKQP